jgi:hypothetical protein
VEAFPGLLDVVEQERLTAGGLAEATRLLRAAEGADDEVAPSPALLRPDFGGGTLKLDVLWTTFACYACGDSEFGSYSLSVTLPTDVLPAKLAPWSKAPGRVTALLEAHPDLTLGGWGEAPPGRRKAFATAKFQLPAVSLQAEPGADLSNPVRAVRDYYEAVDDKRADDAFARFAFPDWDRAKWDQALWSGAGCAEVLDARLVFADDGEGKVAADLCVEDRAAGTIDRWTGAVRVSVAGGRWAMSGWELSKAGSCRPGCVP